MKLRKILQSMPREQLLSIADFWKINVPENLLAEGEVSTAKLVEYLYPRMQTARYFFSVLERLKAEQQQTLKFLAVHGGEVPLHEVIERCYAQAPEVGNADLADLEQKGFVFIDRQDPDRVYVVLPEGVLCHFELGTQLTGFLGALLHKVPYNNLASLAVRLMGEKCWSQPRERLIRLVREYLLNAENLRSHVESLPREEYELLQTLVERDGYAFYGDLLEARGRRRFDLARTEHLNSLIQNRGLVYVASEGSNKYTNLLVIPRDILYMINHEFASDNRSLQELETLVCQGEDYKPAVVIDNSLLLFRDLIVLANFIHSQNLRVLTSGGVSRSDLRRALAFLGPNKSLKYATFLAAFLISAKYLNPVGGTWRLSENFFERLSSPALLYMDLFNWWLEVNDWNEALPEGLIWDEEQQTRGFAGLIEMRHAVIEGIVGWSGNAWIRYPTFEELILPKLVAAAGGSASSTKGDSSARSPVRRILYSILTEPLMWLGLVALGTSDKKAFTPDTPIDLEALAKKQNLKKTEHAALEFSFHPTELAKGLFSLGAIRPRDVFHEIPAESFPLPYSAEWIVVQPNCEIIAPPDLKLVHFARLCSCCTIKTVDVMTTLEISRESLHGALDRGIRGQDVRELLTTLSRTGLPTTVEQLIADCLEKHGEAFIASAGGYLVADDPSVIEQIKLDGKFADYIKDVLNDKGIIFAPGTDLERLAREIKALGLMPRLETGVVQATRDNRYHLSLSLEEYCELLALLRVVRSLDEELGFEIAGEQGANLLQRLEPDTTGLSMVREEALRLAARYEKRLREAVQAIKDQIEEKYKSHVSRLVAKSMSARGTTRFHYRGQNPASERKDIAELLHFAADHELEVEIQYVKRNESEVTLRIYPKSFEGARVYAYCVESDRDAMYSVDRILRATLL